MLPLFQNRDMVQNKSLTLIQNVVSITAFVWMSRGTLPLFTVSHSFKSCRAFVLVSFPLLRRAFYLAPATPRPEKGRCNAMQRLKTVHMSKILLGLEELRKENNPAFVFKSSSPKDACARTKKFDFCGYICRLTTVTFHKKFRNRFMRITPRQRL